MDAIYPDLTYDPIAVAHVLAMPAALFKAFENTMLAGHLGDKTAKDAYQHAILCLRRFHGDYLGGLTAMPQGLAENDAFIDDVEAFYDALWAQHLRNNQQPRTCAIYEKRFEQLSSAHYAGAELLSWFKSDYAFDEQSTSAIQDAIDYLNQAINQCE